MEAAEAEAVDAVEAERAVREVEAAEVVAVADELRDDLAEAERDDREVVAAQPQRRDADQDAEERGEDRRDQDHEPRVEVDPGVPWKAVPPTLHACTCANCCEPSQPAT